MIVLLSPAKTLDFETEVAVNGTTVPAFATEAAALMKVLRGKSATDLSELMKLSEALGELNYQRNQVWKAKHTEANSRPAVFAFQGDVYQGLQASNMKAAALRRCQKHVRILSGLYGVLRPLDLIQPYRLEMGTKLKTAVGKDLYAYWGDAIRDTIHAELQQQKSDLLVNLASQEYSKAAKLKSLDAQVITPAFRDWKNGQYKMISFFAKKARGLMTRFLIDEKVTTADGLLDFAIDGYAHNESLSEENAPVFTRKVTE